MLSPLPGIFQPQLEDVRDDTGRIFRCALCKDGSKVLCSLGANEYVLEYCQKRQRYDFRIVVFWSINSQTGLWEQDRERNTSRILQHQHIPAIPSSRYGVPKRR